MINRFSFRLFRITSFLEGLSYLYLLFASLIQKRLWGMEEAIQIPGMIHGILFLLFVLLLLLVGSERRWFLKKAALFFLYSLLPFGFLMIEHSLKKESS